VLYAVVRRDGTVGDIKVVRSPSTSVAFDEAAVEALQKWRFKPAFKDGAPVDAFFWVVMDFDYR
jgi:TonB family protein